MQEMGFEGVEACVLSSQNTATQYIATRTIMYLCEEMVRILGTWDVKRWWEKDVLDLLGALEVVTASEEEVGAEDMEGEAKGVAGK